ncbi:hypothetical protein [Vreelandella venusta]|uniref:hypothetical protein n=1 Tax=Vreelandella venusta TaxID=44935 RepID=UPI00200DC1E8|nr:hypothetical protein [Halomonas venusta]UQI38790.1 hypothetical protein M3L73_11125 [Halomonas venusta]
MVDEYPEGLYEYKAGSGSEQRVILKINGDWYLAGWECPLDLKEEANGIDQVAEKDIGKLLYEVEKERGLRHAIICIHRATKRHYTEDEFVGSDLDIDDDVSHVGEAYLTYTDNNGWLDLANGAPPMAEDQIADVQFDDGTIRQNCSMGEVDWSRVKSYRPILSSE